MTATQWSRLIRSLLRLVLMNSSSTNEVRLESDRLVIATPRRFVVASLFWMLAAICVAAEPPSKTANHRSASGFIRVTGTIFLSDGSNAANAT